MSSPLLVRGGRLPSGERAEILAVDGRIAAIGSGFATEGAERLDAAGKLVAPALVDLGVFAIDPSAARAGGIAHAALMPDQSLPLDDAALIERAAGAGGPGLTVHPLAAATRGLGGQELAELGLMHAAGARAAATGREAIGSAAVMRRVLAYAASFDLPVVVHAEDPTLAEGAVATAGETATRLGLPAAPAVAEALIVARDLLLAEETGARVHFRQLTTARAFALMREAKARGLPVTCGITPAHLLLSDIAVTGFRSFAHLSPPLRDEADRQAARAALADGTVDVLSSGHDPRGPEAKRLPFAESSSGAAGAATLLALSWLLVRDGLIGPERLFELLARNPARILGLDAGELRVGGRADLIVVDPDAPWRIDERTLPGLAGNTPFDGLPVQGKAVTLVKNGVLVG